MSGQPTWSCCQRCAAYQLLPPPAKNHRRLCYRCHSPFGSGVLAQQSALALTIAAFIFFLLAQFYPLMSIEIIGLTHSSRIGSGIKGMESQGLSPLALLVCGVTIAAPLYRIAAMIYVLAGLCFKRKLPWVIPVFRLSDRLRSWAMLDVFLLGAIVALSKLHDLAKTNVGVGFWALGLLVLMLSLIDSYCDRRVVWDALKSPVILRKPPNPKTHISCHSCELIQPIVADNERSSCRCLRCNSMLHYRKQNSLGRTWALVIAAAVLYIPANLYPVYTLVSFGKSSTSTIMGGVIALLNGRDWPLALIVFTASIVFPMVKLLGLSWLMICIQLKSKYRPIDRTRLYRVIEFVGRWSTIDVFVAALLTALVALGSIATIAPGIGILAFGSVVVLTMLAAESFDPRLIWDAEERHDVR